MVKMKKILSLFLLIAIMAGIFTGCATNDNNRFQSMEDFRQATIGVITGSAHNGLVDKNFPEAKKINFNLMADMLLAVQQGKIDCYIEDSPFMAPLLWEGVAVKSVDEAVAQVTNGFVFPQGEQSKELREQIRSCGKNGNLHKMQTKSLIPFFRNMPIP